MSANKFNAKNGISVGLSQIDVIDGDGTLLTPLYVETPNTDPLIYNKRTIQTFDYVQHCVAPATWTNDTSFVAPGYYSTTADVLNVVGDFFYMGSASTFTDIYFEFNTIISAGTNRKWEYSVPSYQTAVVSGSVAATVLTVTSVISGELHIGDTITDGGTLNATITGFTTGTGGVGTYVISPTSGTITSTTITATGTWANLTIATDETNQWQNNGSVNFNAPVDWTTATVNAVPSLYWIRVGTESGTFVTEPTITLCLPNTTAPLNIMEIHSMDNLTYPDFTITNKGNVSIGLSSAQGYKLKVGGNSYIGGSLTITSAIAGSTSIAFATTLTGTLATTGFTYVGGLIQNAPVATAVIPVNNSPIARLVSQSWNGTVTKTNSMDFVVKPSTEMITRGRLAIKNNTVNSITDTSEVANFTSEGAMNVLGLAQPYDQVFDYVAQYISPTYTEITQTVSNFGLVTGDVLNVAGDNVYFGKRATFDGIQIVISTAKSTGGTFVYEYSTAGDTWTTLASVTDGTVSGTLGPLSQSGNITFPIPTDWTTGTVNGISGLYYVRLRVTGGSFTTEPTLKWALPLNSKALTNEILTDTYFDTGASAWSVTGDWAYTTNDYTFTFAGGSGTLYQSAANFKTPAKPNTWYRFRYIIGVVGPAGTLAWIGTEFAESITYFQVASTTEIDVFFKSNSNPGNFVIYTSASTTSGLQLAGCSLTELLNGDIEATGSLTLSESKFTNFELTTTSASANQVVAEIPATLFRSAKFFIQAVDSVGAKYQSVEINAIHSGADISFTEYAHTLMGASDAASFSVDYSSGYMRLLVTPATTNSTAIKVTTILNKI